MKLRHLAGVMALAILSVACSGGGSGPITSNGPQLDSTGKLQIGPPCEETLAPGRATTSTKDFACQANGTVYIGASYHCTDGRVLAYSGAGWGYIGETAHLFSGTESSATPPANELDRCTG